MTPSSQRQWQARAWTLARKQHWVVAHAQLLELGATPEAVRHRLRCGRLHCIYRGVYVVGRPDPGRLGRLMAAVLAAGEGSVLSHWSAAALWDLIQRSPSVVEVSVSGSGGRLRRRGLMVHARRPALLATGTTLRERIPVTAPAQTIIDLALRLDDAALNRMISEGDKRKLLTPDSLRAACVAQPRRRGAARVRDELDKHTFRLTDSRLEQLFVPLAVEAGLPVPETRRRVNSHRVDFWWPNLGLVVETDGLTYHRLPAQQTNDLIRDQTHAAAGLRSLRFSHWQIRHDPGHVRTILRAVAAQALR